MECFSELKAVKDAGMTQDWLDKEISACRFADEHLEKRFRSLIEKLWNGIGEPLPLACQDWANTKRLTDSFRILELMRQIFWRDTLLLRENVLKQSLDRF